MCVREREREKESVRVRARVISRFVISPRSRVLRIARSSQEIRCGIRHSRCMRSSFNVTSSPPLPIFLSLLHTHAAAAFVRSLASKHAGRRRQTSQVLIVWLIFDPQRSQEEWGGQQALA